MNCYLCGGDKYQVVLDQKETLIWTNAGDDGNGKRQKYRCLIHQCDFCGHVYQPITKALGQILREIYSSAHAQATTPMGQGNWGKQRARNFINKMMQSKGLAKYRSALEIGCADGFILKNLKEMGFNRLTGIEPSLLRSEKVDDIEYCKEFANKELILPRKYDLIFSAWVFEHIKEIDNVIQFCRSNVKDKGTLYFAVPNSYAQLNNGDPALFLHQHVHYYTNNSLNYLLSKNGFKIKDIDIVENNYYVRAIPDGDELNSVAVKKEDYSSYDFRLKKILQRLKKIMLAPKLLVHGANLALNNILEWIGDSYAFDLVDNDETKHGKKYFGRTVRSIDEIILNDYTQLLIIPIPFFKEIKKQYLSKGFKGQIMGVNQ